MPTRSALAVALLLVAAAAVPAAAAAQTYPPAQPGQRSASSAPARGKTELTGLFGYQVNTDVDTSVGSLRVDDTEAYGVSLGFETMPGAWAELLWLYSSPSVQASGVPALAGSSSFQVPSHYFQLGGSKGIRRDRLTGFFGGTIGAALYMPESARLSGGSSVEFDDTWRFAFTLGGGLKVDLGRKLALRFEARLAAPVYFSSGAFYVGSGGSGVSVSGGVPIWQWNFLGGLVFLP